MPTAYGTWPQWRRRFKNLGSGEAVFSVDNDGTTNASLEWMDRHRRQLRGVKQNMVTTQYCGQLQARR